MLPLESQLPYNGSVPDPLPATIKLTELADGVRYVLPRRSMGLFGVIPFMIGIPMAGLTACVDLGHAREVVWWGWWLILAFRIFGSIAIMVGINVVFGRAIIELRRDRLRAASKVLGIGWWRSRPVRHITRFEAVRTPGEQNGQMATSGFLVTLAKLEACGEGRRRFVLAVSYDLRLLTPLADDLNRRLKE